VNGTVNGLDGTVHWCSSTLQGLYHGKHISILISINKHTCTLLCLQVQCIYEYIIVIVDNPNGNRKQSFQMTDQNKGIFVQNLETMIWTTVRTVNLNCHTAEMTGRQWMLPPSRHLIPPLVYPEVCDSPISNLHFLQYKIYDCSLFILFHLSSYCKISAFSDDVVYILRYQKLLLSNVHECKLLAKHLIMSYEYIFLFNFRQSIKVYCAYKQLQ
jgi:hypothetical protein